jgi:hypothetical protein
MTEGSAAAPPPPPPPPPAAGSEALAECCDESEAETEGETDGEPLCETVAVALGAAERDDRAEAVTDTEPLAVLEAELE